MKLQNWIHKCGMIALGLALLSCGAKKEVDGSVHGSDAQTVAGQTDIGIQRVKDAFAEGLKLQCPENTKRVEKRDSSYPEFYCVGAEGRVGPWLEYDAYGRIRTRAMFVKDKMTGEWIQYHPNGQIDLKGEMIENKRNGEWKQWYVDGKIRSVKHYEMNVLNGHVELYYLNGTKMAEGDFVNDFEEGPWKVYTNDGRLARECRMDHGEEKDCIVHVKDFKIKFKSFGDRKIKVTEES